MIEAGLDEAGRGCLAGPVFAAAVIFPDDFKIKELNDSKQLSEKKRNILRDQIINEAVSYSVMSVSQDEIDEINILNASIKAMHLAVDYLKIRPEFLIVDGNRFHKYKNLKHICIIKGDGLYSSIAAASILAKTFRDDFMLKIHNEYPFYRWDMNKGYATETHIDAIRKHGYSSFHRKSFHLKSDQLKLDF
ncbi:MAG: ribonuclease HII [Bacteroidota bacterium]